MNENKIYKRNIILHFKLNLLYFATLVQSELDEQNKNPLLFLFNLDDLKKIQEIKSPDFIKFLYINKAQIYRILFDNEEIISINFDIKDKNISPYIYLSLLIEENPDLPLYEYNLELINKLNDLQNIEKDLTLKKIIMAKIILILISYYEEHNDNISDEENKKILKKMKDSNKDIITNNKNIFKNFNLNENDIYTKKIEEVYINIITTLIKEEKFNDQEYITKIIEELELESLIITNKILGILNKEKLYIKNYEITKYEDIFNKNIINFYFFLFKYIIKSKLYIIKIPFLNEIRTNILKIINNNIDKLYYSIIENKVFKEKIEYVLDFFIEYNYYYKKSEILKNNKERNQNQQSCRKEKEEQILLSSGLVSSQTHVVQSDSEIRYSSSNNPFSIQSYKSANINENFSNEIVLKVLNQSIFKFHTNKKGQEPFILYDEIKIGDKLEKINNIEEIKIARSSNKILNDNYNKFIKYLEEIENKIKNEFIHEYKLAITLKFKNIKFLGISVSENYENDFEINVFYRVEIPKENEPNMYEDKNIFLKDKKEGLSSLITEINADSYKDLIYK